MRHLFTLACGMSLICAHGGSAQESSDPLAAESAPKCLAGPTALVLSGGGAKGMAHIGVLGVVDSLRIKPDLIVGTSIGALIGALYASGYSARQIDSIAQARPLDWLFEGGYDDLPAPLRQRPLWVVFERGPGGLSLRLPAPRSGEVNAILNDLLLRGNLAAQGDFDALPIPLRVVVTELAHARPLALASGDLAQAVRASMALPILFAPEEIHGRFLVDGGLSANIPVRQAREAGAVRVIVSDVTDSLVAPSNPYSWMAWVHWLWDRVNVQQVDSLRAADVRVRPAVGSFGDLDFSPAAVSRLITLGRSAADSILSRSACPFPLVPDPPDTSYETDARSLAEDERRLRAFLDSLYASGRYDEVVLHPSGSRDSLVFDIQLHRVSRFLMTLGFAYQSDIGVQARVGALDRHVMSDAVAVSGEAMLGKLRQEVRFGVRALGLNATATPAFSVSFAHERLRAFDQSGDPLGGRHISEVNAFVGPELDLGGHWFAAFGVGGRVWHESIAANRSSAGIEMRLTRTGRPASTTYADVSWTSAYRRVELQAAASLAAGRVRLAPRLRLGWGRSLPPQGTIPLGGTDGFPGLHIGERRGDREVSVLLGASHPLAGPLQAHVELGVGRTAAGGLLLPPGRWLVGGRVGVGIDTPVGPIRVEYGRATSHRSLVSAQLGTWF